MGGQMAAEQWDRFEFSGNVLLASATGFGLATVAALCTLATSIVRQRSGKRGADGQPLTAACRALKAQSLKVVMLLTLVVK
jgi:hypothetical protein